MIVGDFDHFLNICFFQATTTDLFLSQVFWKKIHQTFQNAVTDFLEFVLVGEVNSEDQVHIVELGSVCSAQDVASRASIQANVSDPDSISDELVSDRPNKMFELHVQFWEVTSSMYGYDVLHNFVQSCHLLIAKNLKTIATVSRSHV